MIEKAFLLQHIKIILLVLATGFCAFSIQLIQPSMANDTKLWVVDGDTIMIGGQRHRLMGYDTPEINQHCNNGNLQEASWPAGQLAKERLVELIGDKDVKCATKGRDQYGQHLSTCYAGGVNLNEIMVKEGWGFVSPKYDQTYIGHQSRAKEQNLGVWRHGCEYPWNFRLKAKFNQKANASRTLDGYMPMPKEFLGYWEPHSRGTANVGMNIKPDIILHQNDGTDFVRYREQYKVFYIDDQYVYALVREQITPEWQRKVLEDLGKTYEKEWGPSWFYKRYSLSPYIKDVDLIVVRYQYCDLTAQDWEAPAERHVEKIQSQHCDNRGWFVNMDTWSRGND